VLFGLHPLHWPALFPTIFFVTSACLCCYLNYYSFLFASVQLHLKNVRSTSAIVCWQQTEMSFLFFNPVKKGWNSSAPPLGLPRDSPPLPHSLYRRTDGRSYVRTLTSWPNFLGLMGYQFLLLMVLRWHASRAEAPLKFIFYLSFCVCEKTTVNICLYDRREVFNHPQDSRQIS